MPGLKKHPPVYPWQYFDWCGPYISDGKFQSSRPGFTTARSAQEQRCKEHDIAYYYCKSQKCFEEADRRFSEASWGTSFIGSAQSLLVYYGGPYFHGEYSEDKKRPAEDTPNQPVKRLRGLPNVSGNKRPAPSNSLSQPKARRRVNFELPVEPNPEDPTGPAKMALPAPTSGNGTQGEIGIKPFEVVIIHPLEFGREIIGLGVCYFPKRLDTNFTLSTIVGGGSRKSHFGRASWVFRVRFYG